MSATLDPKIFKEYFERVSRYVDVVSNDDPEIPVIKCTFNRFEVELFYLEDIKRILNLSNQEVKIDHKIFINITSKF